MNADRHIFALYLKNLSQEASHKTIGDNFATNDKMLGSRIISVLRLIVGDQLILFDEQINITLTIEQLDTKKNRVSGSLKNINKNVSLKPEITLYQCLTQKTAFEEIMYSATQMGVARVVPVISAKVQRKWAVLRDALQAPQDDRGGERERLHKIMISAAEQSKNIVFPVLENPIKFEELIGNFCGQSKNIFFSASGASVLGLLNELSQDKNNALVNVLIGCEGGLTEQEEQRLMGVGWKSYKLTPTILRAVDAVVVGLGSIRSVR